MLQKAKNLQENEKKKKFLTGSNLSEKQNATSIALRVLKELWP